MSRLKTTKEFPIIGKYFYIIDFTKMLKPQLIPLYFLNRNAAKRAIKSNVRKTKQKIYSIIKGERLINSDLPYILKNGVWGKFTKYEYKPELTPQEKKNIRTMARRRLRRMNLYTSVRARNLYTSAPKYIKLIKNTQKVANSPNTTAKCLQLERKPKSFIYIIVKKRPPKRSQYIISLKAIKINIKTRNYSYLNLNIHKTDIIIPLLLKEVNEKIQTLENRADIIKFCEKKKITL